jgi:23S rRNA (adenine2503-C2)-methyltransferase
VTSGDPIFILDHDIAQLEASLVALGEPAYRARQVWRWLYRRLANSFGEMTDLPRSLRDRLAGVYTVDAMQPIAQQASPDRQTHKTLFKLSDGATIETVLMIYDATEINRARRTVCISTQAGCALGCAFCATGQGGLVRNLTPGEIVGQVLHMARSLAADNQDGETKATQQAESNGASSAPNYAPTTITNVIFAGMGEPLANYNATLAAVRRLNDADGFALGARHMIISTAGLVPGIRRLTDENLQVNLAISLHAPTDDVRSRLMPINKQFPLAELLPACRDFVEKTGRRIAFEYILIEGLNSLPTQARQLAALLQGLTCMVNLIPMNPVAGSGLAAPKRETVVAFQAILDAAGITATVRMEKGRDIQAACGQLRGRVAAA